MGYRSEVAVAVTEKCWKMIVREMGSNPDLRELIKHADQKHYDAETRSRLFYWQYIKWYVSYDGVAGFEHACRSCDSEEYYILRIGEDLNDIESEGNYWDSPFDIQCSRSINFSTPTKASP